MPAKQKLCVIGDPVLHSKSPLIQNTMIEVLGLDCEYLCQPVSSAELPRFMADMQAGNWAGCNVTMPHKQAVLPHLNGCSEAATLCGSVNTICNRSGSLYGYSTDGGGFLRSLAEYGFYPEGKIVTLLGAGGAAKSVALALYRAGASSVRIANRTVPKATELCRLAPSVLEAHSFDTPTLCRLAETTDLLVNCTSLGMGGTAGQFEDFSCLDCLPAGATVYDLIYFPAETELLRRAGLRGLAAHNGLGMLLHQAILALELFTGRPIDPAQVLPAVRLALQSANL